MLLNCRAGFTPNYPRVRENDDGRAVNGQTLHSDFHMWFSHANLIDNFTLDGDSWLAQYRGYGNHGIAAAQNVFWNTNVIRPHIIHYLPKKPSRAAVVSDQWGWGYVIGMRGPWKSNLLGLKGRSNPGDPHPKDFHEPASLLEGDGRGDALEPKSLYLDQRVRRLGQGRM